jgi:pyruvate formate lyase activating enzyme
MGVREVMAEIGQDRVFYDSSAGGVTFSGGEPLQQPEFLAALLRACQEEEIHTAVDTCGFAAPSAFDQVSPDTDLFLYDLKLMDDAAHRHYTGVSNRLILENLRRLAHRGAAVTVRVPVIPGISDDAGNLDAIGRFVASLGAVNQVDLLPYHRMAADKYGRLHRKYRIPATEPPSTERMEQLAEGLRQWGIAVTIGG